MLVIVGLGGDHENAERFHRWATAIVDAAKDRYALPPEQQALASLQRAEEAYCDVRVQGAPPDQAATFEEQIGADIEAVESKLREAAGDMAAPEREARERRTEAEALRRELQALGVDARELDALISNMRALDSARVYTDLDEAARLQTQLAEGFKRFEFDLRRKLGAAGADQLLLGGSDDTPAAYKKLVEDYYRALAKDRKK